MLMVWQERLLLRMLKDRSKRNIQRCCKKIAKDDTGDVDPLVGFLAEWILKKVNKKRWSIKS